MALKLHEIKKLHTRWQSNVLLFKALDRMDEAGWQADQITKFSDSGFLLARESWGHLRDGTPEEYILPQVCLLLGDHLPGTNSAAIPGA